MQEWEEVRAAAIKLVIAEHNETNFEIPVNMLGKTMDPRRPYILSAIPQKELIGKFHISTVGLITLFFLCGGLATWMFSIHFAGA